MNMASMHRWVSGITFLFVMAALTQGAQSKEAASKAKAKKPIASTASAAFLEKQAKEKEALAQLNGTVWGAELFPTADPKAKKPLKDKLHFEGTRLTSEAMSKEGYPPSNFSLAIGGDGVIVWETMQTKEGAGVAFWRAEVQGETLRGILSKHPTEGAPIDYSFTAKLLEKKEPEVAPEVSPPPPAPAPAPVPVVEEPAPKKEETAPKKKSKGWW